MEGSELCSVYAGIHNYLASFPGLLAPITGTRKGLGTRLNSAYTDDSVPALKILYTQGFHQTLPHQA